MDLRGLRAFSPPRTASETAGLIAFCRGAVEFLFYFCAIDRLSTTVRMMLGCSVRGCVLAIST